VQFSQSAVLDTPSLRPAEFEDEDENELPLRGFGVLEDRSLTELHVAVAASGS